MSVVFFTDRDLGNRFPDILSSAGLRVERHRDHFKPAISDEEWLAAVAPFPELAQNFVATMSRIERFLAHHRPPMIAKIYRPAPADLKRNAKAGGSVSLWYPQ